MRQVVTSRWLRISYLKRLHLSGLDVNGKYAAMWGPGSSALNRGSISAWLCGRSKCVVLKHSKGKEGQGGWGRESEDTVIGDEVRAVAWSRIKQVPMIQVKNLFLEWCDSIYILKAFQIYLCVAIKGLSMRIMGCMFLFSSCLYLVQYLSPTGHSKSCTGQRLALFSHVGCWPSSLRLLGWPGRREWTEKVKRENQSWVLGCWDFDWR